MKFGKTYMETMADPSFPKEWRQGAIEYKHLKKLINGVVAELESLGLGADVLRELLVSHVDDVKGKVSDGSGSGSGSDSKPAPHPTATKSSTAPHKHGSAADSGSDSPSNEDALCSSATGSDSLSPLSEEPDPLEGQQHEETPAERWLRSFSADKFRSSSFSGVSSRRPDIEGLPSMERSESYDADVDADVSSPVVQRRSGDAGLASAPLPAKARRASHSARDRSAVSPLRQSADSGDDEFNTSSLDRARWSGLGRKDLAAMRACRHSALEPPIAEPRQSEPSPGRHDWGGLKWRNTPHATWDDDDGDASRLRRPSPVPRASAPVCWVEGKAGRRARAEYELGGTPDHPVPRIRLFVESPLSSEAEETGAEAKAAADDGEDDNDDDNRSTVARIVELPPSPRMRSSIPENGPEGESLEEKRIRQSEIRKRRGVRSREIVIPLTADTEFLDTLTGALQNLSNIQETQRENFVAETESLCSAVARASSPYASKNDLYVWREIFSLWVDFQIFESQREKDRGELSVDESEARLKRFTEELVKRGWMASPGDGATATTASGRQGGSRIGFKGKLIKRKVPDAPSSQGLNSDRSAQAIEDFLKLNFALLDVKKFQRVNVEAARKILKKHDKRTALTASIDLRMFMAQQEMIRRRNRPPLGPIEVPSSALMPQMADAASMGALVPTTAHPSLAALLPSSMTGLLSESLPHILLSLLSTTLLPILPSVDDYSCAICTSVAWRPIRLDCSHLFCIRCLVKLQKQGKADCPLCRCPGAVANADGRNMDEAASNFMQTWFPKEVSEKSSENEAERHREELEEMGLTESEKCTIC
ncbi:hypothetical protein ACQY0O_001625 [Thecaphora frezii]